MPRRMDSLSLGDQLSREWKRSGINFRVMLVGESGLGKTTFTRALLRPYVPEHLLDQGTLATDLSEPLRARTVGIQEITHSVENDGFPIAFEIIDCPGYGDAVDSTGWIDDILGYVVKRFEKHYDALGNPPKMDGEHTSMNALQRDGLVHVCLYFIAAHRLKGIDLEFMRRLEPYVNLVPVIAKADTMTLAERDAFRRHVLSELRKNDVNIFHLTDDSVPANGTGANGHASDLSSLDEAATPTSTPRGKGRGLPPASASEVAAVTLLGAPPNQAAPNAPRATTQPPPFAVCASDDGTRIYPWGTCCAEDPTHSDLSTLRSMLFASSMVSAKKTTLQLYEASYAKARRQREAETAARQARALARQQLLGKACVFTVASTCVSFAAAGVFGVIHPEMAAAGVTALQQAVERLKEPRELLLAALQGGLAAVSAAIERAARRSSPALTAA